MSEVHDADVLVIGAGTGALTAAAYLAAAGRKIIVVDPGTRPGGLGTVFERGGYEFDVGLDYVGSDKDGRPTPERMLTPLGIVVQWNRLDPTDTIVCDDGSRFAVPTGADAWREALREALPGEGEAVDRFVRTIVELEQRMDTLLSTRGVTDVPGAVRSALPVLRYRNTTVGDVFDSLACSAKARLLLGWMATGIGLPPSETPLELYAMLALAFVRGGWYPRGGGSVIADHLAGVIRANGGQILLEHRVTGITVRAGTVRGATVAGADGTHELLAPVVVSGADLKHTYLDLLEPQDVPRRLRREVRGYEMALPAGVVFTVINRDLREEGLPVTNYLVGGDGFEAAARAAQAGRFPQRPFVWITSSTLKDPGYARGCREGQSIVELLGVAPPRPAAWGLQLGTQDGDFYAAAKRTLRDRLVTAAEQAIPGFGEAIAFEHVATPYTFSRYAGTTDGTGYGIAETADQAFLNRPGSKTHIKGLFLTGASTRPSHGIDGVMAGGILAATAVLGSSAVRTVRNRAATAVT